ncbi:L-asparaginase 1-like [Anneissia japonica]|uniref:L-asparaginase 1-like n=1 Tax=Anneissia japonica TaxID=1529436 RepID=UPI00142550E0|nr:L-asparaginase 1-like [Anneissia japonica]
MDSSVESRVLVLYTGGTIGMTRNSDGDLVPVENYFSQAVRRNTILNDADYEAKTQKTYALPLSHDHTTRVLYFICEYSPLIDSSNITVQDWQKLAGDIEDNYKDYNGFVIVHGTDTMAYTASALSFMFENLGKPVILTGSQIPLEETLSDGTGNLLGAVYLAGNYPTISEVTLYFDYKLFRGNRVTKLVNNELNAFGSPNLDPLVRMEIDVVVDWDSILQPKSIEKFKVFTNLNCNVGLLRLFPSITVETVRSFLKKPMQGVVLQTYGAGNGPSDREEILAVLEEASDRGVLILNCSQCIKGVVSDSYETGSALIKAGVIPGADINPEAGLAKLSYVLNKEKTTNCQKILLQRNLRGEIRVSKVNNFSLKDSKFIQAIVDTLEIANSQEVKSVSTTLLPVLMCAAAQNGDLNLLKQYASKGGNLSRCDYDKRTPLHMAVCEGHVDIVKYLVESGCSIYAKDRFGNTPFVESLRYRNIEVIELIKQAGGHSTPEMSQKILSLMKHAIEIGDVDGLKAFHIAEVDFNTSDETGRTALHRAVELQKTECIKYLLDNGANIDASDTEGLTPLGLSQNSSSEDISALLMSYSNGSRL